MTSEEVQYERRQALGQKENYCPFGCSEIDLDPNGYCHHLVGFTNDGKVMDTVQKMTYRGHDTGLVMVSGNKAMGHIKPVLPTDTLVNPTKRQKDDQGLWTETVIWVSSRVYRRFQDKVEEEAKPVEKPKKKRAITPERKAQLLAALAKGRAAKKAKQALVTT